MQLNMIKLTNLKQITTLPTPTSPSTPSTTDIHSRVPSDYTNPTSHLNAYEIHPRTTPSVEITDSNMNTCPVISLRFCGGG